MKKIVVVLLLAMLLPIVSAAGAPPDSAGVQIRFASDPLMMCHYYLKVYGPASVKPPGPSDEDFISEATAYAQASKVIADPQVVRWFEERVASSKDIPSLKGAAASLPASLQSEESATGVRMMLDAMISAYPKYVESVYPDELRGVNRVLVGASRRYASSADRIQQVLMSVMGFHPIDREIVLFNVIRTGGVSSWGLSEKSYFTVLGVFGHSPYSLIETGIHEATHILDAMQPYSANSVLQEVRRGADAADRDEIEVFLHGLVAFNAGELVKRFVSLDHAHVGVRAPGHAESYRPYLSTYEYIWTDYMSGKIPRDGIAKKLLEEFAAVKKLRAGS